MEILVKELIENSSYGRGKIKSIHYNQSGSNSNTDFGNNNDNTKGKQHVLDWIENDMDIDINKKRAAEIQILRGYDGSEGCLAAEQFLLWRSSASPVNTSIINMELVDSIYTMYF